MQKRHRTPGCRRMTVVTRQERLQSAGMCSNLTPGTNYLTSTNVPQMSSNTCLDDTVAPPQDLKSDLPVLREESYWSVTKRMSHFQASQSFTGSG